MRGATWPIAEPDLLGEIEVRLLEMERSGELARLEARGPRAAPGGRWRNRSRCRGSRRQGRNAVALFDPAIVVERDIRTADGAPIAAAGTRGRTPLELMSLTRALLFVDGRRDAEIAWALAHGRPAKIVLLAGRPLELMRRHRRPFFFDTGGRLAARFRHRSDAEPGRAGRDAAAYHGDPGR